MSHPLPLSQIAPTVARLVASAPVYDIHTHLYDPALGEILLWGIDEQLTYHYLVAEAFRCLDLPYARFWSMNKTEQADLIWSTLFVERAPVSEATRGVVTSLNLLGLDVGPGELPRIRRWFAEQKRERFVDLVLEKAGVRALVMTNSPFDELECPGWERGFARDARFKAALRIDPLLHDWPQAVGQLQHMGYPVSLDFTAQTLAEVRRFLADWARRLDALYVMASLPPSYVYPDDSAVTTVIEKAILPFCREHGLPFALMPGVKPKLINPGLRIGGYGMGRVDLDGYERLIGGNPDVKFLLTVLSRENQHQVCVMARKFRNLHPFGCWWFLNNPVIIEDMTRMRLEMLGLSFTAQHSDARVLDQLLYKWPHFRALGTKVLTAKYEDTAQAGWPVTETMIAKGVHALLGGEFERFLPPAKTG
jgi:hypothetical protein